MRRRVLTAVVMMTAAAAACGPAAPPPKKTAPDRQVLQDVNAAVNAVVRSPGDCETTRPLIATARERIAWASGQVELPGSAETLRMQSAQLDRYAQLCP
jgi:hypothetical protein